MSKCPRYVAIAMAIILAVGVWAPSTYAQDRVLRVFSSDNSSGAFLGIQMIDVTKENMAEHELDSVQGVIVQSIVEGSSAEAAELKEKDVILEFDGLKVRSKIQFSRLVNETPVGREVKLLISRAGKRKNITVRLGERNEQRAESRPFTIPAPFGEQGNRSFSYRFPEDAPILVPWTSRDRAPRLGITILALTEQLAMHFEVPGEKGVLITSVQEGSPSTGKLQAGDVIVRADGKDVQDPADLTGIVQRATGNTISFDVIRNKREIKVVVNLPGGNDKEGDTGKEYRL